MESCSHNFDKIHKEALDRLKKVEYNNTSLLNLFGMLLEDAEHSKQDTIQLMLGLIEEGDTFIPRTYVPEVWLVLRKVNE